MSAQISDKFVYNNEMYELSVTQYSLGFDVRKFGINPRLAYSRRSLCFRGYDTVFSIKKNKLVLKKLGIIPFNKEAEPPEINGVLPTVHGSLLYDWYYEGINLEFPYTGALLIVKDLIEEEYVDIGFQRPLSFRKAIELTFKKGVFLNANDISETFNRIRKTSEANLRYKEISSLPFWIVQCVDDVSCGEKD